MAVSIRGTAPPSRIPNPHIRILNLRAGNKALVKLLGAPEAVFVHWTEHGQVPCTGPGCAQCPLSPARWQAYAPAVVQNWDQGTGKQRWRKTVLPVTVSAAWDLQDLEVGQTLVYYREAGRRNAALRFASARDQSGGTPGEPFDVRPYLERVWGRPWPSEQGSASPPDANQVLQFPGSARGAQQA